LEFAESEFGPSYRFFVTDASEMMRIVHSITPAKLAHASYKIRSRKTGRGRERWTTMEKGQLAGKGAAEYLKRKIEWMHLGERARDDT